MAKGALFAEMARRLQHLMKSLHFQVLHRSLVELWKRLAWVVVFLWTNVKAFQVLLLSVLAQIVDLLQQLLPWGPDDRLLSPLPEGQLASQLDDLRFSPLPELLLASRPNDQD